MFHDIETEVLKQLLSNVLVILETSHDLFYAVLEAKLLREFADRGYAMSKLGVMEPQP